jgi:RNA polymerase sigma factor (sigma-70 family)
LSAEDKHAFVTGLAASHGERLRRYLASRLRSAKRDVPDLAQEVFFRLWRINRPETIRNPEAYLFTIANHVLHQYALKQTPALESLSVSPEPVPEEAQNTTEAQVELQQRLMEVDKALGQLSYRTQAALILYRRDGFSLEEIATELGVSLAMVKKYLAKAILHCRQQMPADE